MQAILTRLLSPTDTKGTRIKASCQALTITVGYDHGIPRDHEANHRRAAERLVDQLGWTEEGYGTLVSGCLPSGDWCHVLTGRDGKGG
jgi:hypothetical protein